jgi:NAD(P)H-dependent flavin oxidoreductase YrpB (nitropropane dioxygenase family)
MNVAAGPELAAAVTNAGGLGVIGGVGYTPAFLTKQIEFLKAGLKEPNAPFGIDLLLPQVGDGARKTNFDYTKGTLPELIDIICKSGCKLFVSAVGVPPRWAVDKLHQHKIPVMNMIGAPKHVGKAIEAGVDIICAQGGEGGGHTGDVPTSMLIPVVVDLVKGHKSPLTGEQISVIAAGGIFDGRGLAMALCLGADAVWVGTRFVCSVEAGAPQRHKDAIVQADFTDTIRTLIFTGRPLRVIKNEYIMDWETNRSKEILALTGKGVLPYQHDIDEAMKNNEPITKERMKQAMEWRPLLSGQVCGAIHDIKPAAEIINEMVQGAIDTLKKSNNRLAKL